MIRGKGGKKKGKNRAGEEWGSKKGGGFKSKKKILNGLGKRKPTPKKEDTWFGDSPDKCTKQTSNFQGKLREKNDGEIEEGTYFKTSSTTIRSRENPRKGAPREEARNNGEIKRTLATNCFALGERVMSPKKSCG